MTEMGTVALVALFGAVGGVMRLGVVSASTRWAGTALPWGTLAVNLGGSAALGAFAALADPAAPAALWAALAVGLLGSFTTVSAFADQVVALARGGRRGAAAGYAAASLALAPLAAAAAHALFAR